MWAVIGALRATAPRRSCYEGDSVVVAASGGVDSSVTLRLLSELPLNLSVLFMRNWDPVLSENAPESSLSLAYNNPAVHSPCTWERDWADARAVARHIGIPDNKVRLVDLTAEYWTRVFEPSIAEWEQARTPNPDVWCNREIKFGALLKHIPEGHFLATGHYARVRRQGGRATLHRAHDMNKDQTFYLSQVTEAALQRAVFPLAGLPKPAVRELAREWHLPTAERRESMGLCFIGKRRNFGDFVSQYVPPTTGWFVNEAGQRVGEHKGLSQYTVGQRARIILLKPGLKSDMWGKLFVARKGVNGGNDILVVPRTDHPALLCDELWSDEFNWIAGEPPLLEDGHELMAQVRHRESPFRAHMRVEGSRVYITFPDPRQCRLTTVIVASHRIKAGDEITVGYCSPEVLRLAGRARRKQILARYLFDCKCPTCAHHPAVRKASDTNRHRLGAILAGWEKRGIDHCLGTARAETLAEVEEAVRLCRTERLAGDLSTIWLQKFYVHAAHAEYDMAKYAARKAVAALSRVRGSYAAQKHWLASYAHDPAAWETYGICIPTQR
ncbi:hypothetical protein CspHIS471_0202350 [Cutaneotrichosporon sp. HIS471]|nr:hypothetical protein CspHIS471_0202350 [Cutaneotrichosporon sp. HIS471]